MPGIILEGRKLSMVCSQMFAKKKFLELSFSVTAVKNNILVLAKNIHILVRKQNSCYYFFSCLVLNLVLDSFNFFTYRVYYSHISIRTISLLPLHTIFVSEVPTQDYTVQHRKKNYSAIIQFIRIFINKRIKSSWLAPN